MLFLGPVSGSMVVEVDEEPSSSAPMLSVRLMSHPGNAFMGALASDSVEKWRSFTDILDFDSMLKSV